MDFPGVSQCCILVHDQQLHAFLVSGESREALLKLTSERLPDYMHPFEWHFLSVMPLNSNGKADRKELKAKLEMQPPGDSESIHEEGLAFSCWKDVLGHRRFGPQTRFEDAGGNSVLLMKMQAWLEKNTGRFVAIRDLIRHNSPELLEELLRYGSEELPLPQEFPLNRLQKDILILESGNQYGKSSPFFLRFKVQLRQEVSKENWASAVEMLLEQYPGIAVVLTGLPDLQSVHWKRNPLSDGYVEPFPEFEIRNGEPLIRFIRHSGKSIEIQWHHVLLDGLGMSILMRNLGEVLEGKFRQRVFPTSLFLKEPEEKPGMKVKTCGSTARIFHAAIETEELQKVADFCSENRLEQSHFWYRLAAAVQESDFLAVADIAGHPGLPGMFTELKIMSVNPISGPPQTWWKPAENPVQEVEVVANFMLVDSSSDWVEKMEVQHPSHLKYPNEWQFVLLNNRLEIGYYATWEDSNAPERIPKLMELLNRLLKGESLSLIQEKPGGTALFDDFDF
jgi:hypothetical protein